MAGYFSVRMPIGGYPYRKRDGSIGIGKHPLKGFPDIFGVLKKRRGVMFVVEFKSAKGIVEDEQEEWLWRLRQAGVVTIVARDLHSMIDAIQKAENAA